MAAFAARDCVPSTAAAKDANNAERRRETYTIAEATSVGYAPSICVAELYVGWKGMGGV